MLTKAHHQSQHEPAQCHKRNTCHTKKEGQSHQAPRLPHKAVSMSANAMPPKQSTSASPASRLTKARHQSQPSATSAMLATQKEGQCHQVPRLPHKRNVDVINATLATHKHHAYPASMPTKARHQRQQGYKCHACHTKGRSMYDSKSCVRVVCEKIVCTTLSHITPSRTTRSHTQLCHTHNMVTHNSVPHNSFTLKNLSHNSFTYDSVTQGPFTQSVFHHLPYLACPSHHISTSVLWLLEEVDMWGYPVL